MFFLQSTGGVALDGTFVIGDHPDATSTGLNGNTDQDAWNDGDRSHLGMWVKNGSALSDKTVQITVLVKNTTGQVRQLSFATKAGTDGQSGDCVTDYLGTACNDGGWHYLEFDLAANLSAIAGESLEYVHGLVIRCADLYVDDIILSSGALNRSWAQVPGAALGGYLGAQTGSEGANGVDAWDKYYYHFSDLGTVLATTDDAGAMLGVYQPDFWGNYRETSGTRPDTMGLTGKFFDNDTDLYYFNARWYDSERGRWMSKEPSGQDGPNLYHFVFNAPLNKLDMNGLDATEICYGDELSNAKNAARHCRRECKGCGFYTPMDRRGCGSKSASQGTCMQICLKKLPTPYKEAAKKCVSVFTVNHYHWSFLGFFFMHSQTQFYVNGGNDLTGRVLSLRGTTDTCSELLPPYSNDPKGKDVTRYFSLD